MPWKEFFPYEPRLNQDNIANFVLETAKNKKIGVIEAPYGIGKSISMLSSALTLGKKVVFVTCNTSAHNSIVDEVLKINEKLGKKLIVASLVGKEKLCAFENSFSYDYCDYLRKNNECDYYKECFSKQKSETQKGERKISQKCLEILKIIEEEIIKNPRTLAGIALHKHIKELSLKKGVCPYEVIIQLIKRADVVILDYFHIFSNIYTLTKTKMGIEPNESVLFIDEADELKDRILSILTKQMSLLGLLRLKEQVKKVNGISDSEIILISEFASAFAEFFKNKKEQGTFDINKEEFIEYLEKKFGKLDDLIKDLEKIVNKVAEVSEKISSKPNLFLESWLKLNKNYFSYGVKEQNKEVLAIAPYELKNVVILKDLNGEYLIQDILKEFSSSFLFSATIGNHETFVENLGLNKENTEFFSSKEFNTQNFKVILRKDISSIYTKRKENSLRVAKDVLFLSKLCNGLLLAFPSYASSRDILPLINAENLEDVKECINQPGKVYYVVLGGKNSRGINKAHNLEGVYIYGIQIPKPDDYFFVKRKDYLIKNYGEEKAYKLIYNNTMSKTCQTAGRIFRTRNKKGLVIFADSRYKYDFRLKSFFYDSFPEYFKRKLIETNTDNEFRLESANFWGKLVI